MKCPACGSELRMAERQGVEIDYCPQCRGVWLDRGELDKIIERAAVATAPSPPWQGDEPRPYDRDRYSYKHKRRSFLGELFDFD